MDSRKLERIVLLVLLLLNAFLLAVVLSDSAQTRRSNAETAASLTAMLNENGLSVADGAVQIRSAPPKYTLTRDLAQEQRIVKRLIGEKQTEDQGGNIFFYEGTRGRALLRGSGELDMLFDSGAVPRRSALRLLRRAGINAVAANDAEDGEDAVQLYCTLDGIPVYNAVLQADFVGGSFYMLSGTRIFDSAVKRDSDGLLDSVSVLLRFLEIVRTEGYICSRIEAVEPAYLQTVTRSGEAELAPIWRIGTDTGAVLIDAERGEAVTIGIR